jgi:hypothetical protein
MGQNLSRWKSMKLEMREAPRPRVPHFCLFLAKVGNHGCAHRDLFIIHHSTKDSATLVHPDLESVKHHGQGVPFFALCFRREGWESTKTHIEIFLSQLVSTNGDSGATPLTEMHRPCFRSKASHSASASVAPSVF